MKMVQSSITLAFLLAGADAFATTPECKGHTGDLALPATRGLPCSTVLPGYDADKASCEFDEKGADTILTVVPGMSFAVKDVCPEKCGNPCAHAPTEDVVAGVMKDFKKDLTLDCPGAKAAGLCESDMVVNWFCGKSCRSGAQWDECSFAAPGSVFMTMNSAEASATRACANSWAAYGYGDAGVDCGSGTTDCIATEAVDGTAECLAAHIPGYIATADGTCPRDTTGGNCWQHPNFLNYGSTQVNQCPSESRRKLSTQADPSPSEYVTTEGVFTLTFSGSK